MKRCPVLFVLFVACIASNVQAQVYEDRVVNQAAVVLTEIMDIPARRIPAYLLHDAHGLVIIPDVIKGGFVVGLRHGRGVMLVRDETGAWRPPVFVSLTGGSIGWQAGLQSTDVVLVFRTPNSVQGVMDGKFTIGADAAAAAGPVGRQTSAATDARLRAEIYSYSRSRGLFAGVSIDGSSLQVDTMAGMNYYHPYGMTPLGDAAHDAAQLPPSAARLMSMVATFTGTPPAFHGVMPAAADVPMAAAAPLPTFGPETMRRRLAEASQQMQHLLDEQWKHYLALPGEVYEVGAHPHPEALQQALQRYDAIASDPQFRTLGERPEFRTTQEHLRRYLMALSGDTPRIHLPPPPR